MDHIIPQVEKYDLSAANNEEDQVDLRKGPWTVEEDSLLFNYVSLHGEGRWNSLARHAGSILLLKILIISFFFEW